jgi:hypothetical protein
MPAAHGTPKPPASDCHGHDFVSPVPWRRRLHDDYRMFIPAAAVGWAKRRRAHGKSSSVIPHPYLVEPEYVREIFGPGPLLGRSVDLEIPDQRTIPPPSVSRMDPNVKSNSSSAGCAFSIAPSTTLPAALARHQRAASFGRACQ